MIENVKNILQVILFHQKIFNPSIMLSGKRLKRAIHALKAAPHMAMSDNGALGTYKKTSNNVVDNIMFVTGPTKAVFPAIFFPKIRNSLRCGSERFGLLPPWRFLEL